MAPLLSAVVVAAGRSERFLRELGELPGASTSSSKLLIAWEGKALIRHTVEKLFSLPLQQMVIVGRQEDFSDFEDSLIGLPERSRIKFALGGNRRQDSVRNGLAALDSADMVLVHDGARPFVSADFLKSLLDRSQNAEALIPAVPVYETLKEIDEDGFVVRTVSRNAFVRVQTPQFFRFDLLRAAHQKMAESDQEFTDDAALMEACGYRVRVVPGHPENIKVTLPEDLKFKGIHV